MKYSRMLRIFFFVTIVQTVAILFGKQDEDVANKDLVAEMRAFAPRCKELSLEEMKAFRLQFLHDNETETVGNFMKALEESNIIGYLESHDRAEYAEIMKKDRALGQQYWYAHWVSIKTAMVSGVLK